MSKDITDIIFQRPERITAGTLNNLSLKQRLTIGIVRSIKPFEKSHYAPKSFDRYKSPLSTAFQLTYEKAPVSSYIAASDRSLLSAKKELVLLGLSHRQVSFIFERMDTLFTEIYEAQSRARGMDINWLDDERAYLGKIHLDDVHGRGYLNYYEAFPEDVDDLYKYALQHFEKEIAAFPHAYSYAKGPQSKLYSK